MKKILAILMAALFVVSSLSAFADTYNDRDTVKKVQQALNDAGYNCGTPDGIAGKKTYAAIGSYQRDKGLAETQQIDDTLLEALGLAEAATAAEPVVSAIDDSAYTIINNGSVPQMPTQLVELTGGIPDSIDLLKDRYGLEAMEGEYEKWEAAALEIMESFEQTGKATIPDFLLTSDTDFHINYNSENVFLFLDQVGDQYVITLAAPQQTDLTGVFVMDSEGHFEPLQNAAEGDFRIIFYPNGENKPGYRYSFSRNYGETSYDNFSLENVFYRMHGNEEDYYSISCGGFGYDNNSDYTISRSKSITAGVKGSTWFADYDESGKLSNVRQSNVSMR